MVGCKVKKMAAVGGGSSCLWWWVARWRNFKIFYCFKWAKKTKKKVFFLFFPHLGGWWVALPLLMAPSDLLLSSATVDNNLGVSTLFGVELGEQFCNESSFCSQDFFTCCSLSELTRLVSNQLTVKIVLVHWRHLYKLRTRGLWQYKIPILIRKWTALGKILKKFGIF